MRAIGGRYEWSVGSCTHADRSQQAVEYIESQEKIGTDAEVVLVLVVEVTWIEDGGSGGCKEVVNELESSAVLLEEL